MEGAEDGWDGGGVSESAAGSWREDRRGGGRGGCGWVGGEGDGKVEGG